MRRLLILIAVVCLTAGLAHTATIPVNESFTGGSLPAGFTEADTSSSGREIYYTANGVEFDRDENDDNGRNYVRTADTDYNTVSFAAEITVQAALGDQEYGNSSQFYLGMGTGDIGQYGVPDRNGNNASATFILNQSDNTTADRVFFGTEDGSNWNQVPLLDPYPAAVTTSTHRLRMEYDASAVQMRLIVDFDYAGGPFTADFTSDWQDVGSLNGADGWGGGEAASIFFGGDSDDGDLDEPTLAWDFNVVPEPATLGLVSLGGLLFLLRRKSR
jgi:hypothetical protein